MPPGFEGIILEGARKTIKQNMPLIIIDIKTIDSMGESGKMLASLGYKIHPIYFNDYLLIPPTITR